MASSGYGEMLSKINPTVSWEITKEHGHRILWIQIKLHSNLNMVFVPVYFITIIVAKYRAT